MNLYKATNGLGWFYVVAYDFTTAAKVLENKLTIANFGQVDSRRVKEITLVACEVIVGSDGKPEFCGGNNLIIG